MIRNAIAVLAIMGGAACRTPPEEPSCIVELAAPAYPSIAAAARVRVSGIQAVVRLQRGQVVDVQQIYPPEAARFESLFRVGLDQAVRRSRFREACTDRSESIFYDFVYADPAYKDPPDSEPVTFVPPNKIVVATTGRTIDFANQPR